MENLKIASTETTPEVHFDFETGECYLSGDSYSENATQFFEPIMQWLQNLINNNPKKIQFDFKLNYFNTNSSKRIMEIIKFLKDFNDKGGKVTINWYYEEGDIDLEEEIEDYILVTGADINCFPV